MPYGTHRLATGPDPTASSLSKGPERSDGRVGGEPRNRTSGLAPSPVFKAGRRPSSGTLQSCPRPVGNGSGSVGVEGLEPPTTLGKSQPLSQLSYTPEFCSEPLRRIERLSTDYKTVALPLS